MPGSIELKTENFKMNAPIKIASFNLATILTEALKSSFPEGEGFEIYDMVNYKGVQAFLIGYQMDLLKSFNPDDYLKMPEGIQPIYPEPIVIPKMTTNAIADTWFYFEMQAFFNDMRDRINNDSTPETEEDITVYHDVDNNEATINLATSLPPFMVFKAATPSQDNFEAAFVHTGTIALNIHLKFDGHPTSALDPNDITIELDGIEMQGPIYNKGNPNTPQKVTLNSGNNHSNLLAPLTININDTEIDPDSQPRFTISSIKSSYSGSVSGGVEGLKFTLVIQPQIQNITLRGAKALKIGYMEKPVPDEIVDNIKMDAIDDMVNAQIQDGSFRIVAAPPYSAPDSVIPDETTYCKDLDIGYKIVIRQDPDDLFSKSLGGFELTDTHNSLANEWISGKELTVNTDKISQNPDKYVSYITIQAKPSGTTFELFPDTEGIYERDPFGAEVMPVKMDMGMDINELALVRWKTDSGILPKIHIPPIGDFANMGDEKVSFIRSITFSEIRLKADFTVPTPPPPPPDGYEPLTPGGPGLSPELEGRIALKITCEELGFDDTEKLQKGMNTFTSNPTAPLVIHDPNVNTVKPPIQFTADLIPVITDTNGDEVIDETSSYIEFGPVSGNKEIKMHIYADVSVEFEWTEAKIDLKAALKQTSSEDVLTGTFPKGDGGDGNDVDLSKMGDYMSGIGIGDVQAKLYVSGPAEVVAKIHPRLHFDAQYVRKDGEPYVHPIINDKEMVAGEKLPTLPGINSKGEWEYLDTTLPDEGKGVVLDDFDKIIADYPRNLRFYYEMNLGEGEDGEIIVYPDSFKDDEDHQIGAKLLLLLPLELVVTEERGYFMIPDLFEKDKDLFGRENAEDASLFTGVNINSLGIKIDFGYPLFAGSYLHFNEEDEPLFGAEGLHLGNSNHLNINLTNKQRELINNHLIKPDIKFEFKKGKRIQIDRKILPVRIVITANGSYTLNLDDLGLGN
jgi:hypothetical protein